MGDISGNTFVKSRYASSIINDEAEMTTLRLVASDGVFNVLEDNTGSLSVVFTNQTELFNAIVGDPGAVFLVRYVNSADPIGVYNVAKVLGKDLVVSARTIGACRKILDAPKQGYKFVISGDENTCTITPVPK